MASSFVADRHLFLDPSSLRELYRFTSPDGLKWKQDDYPKNVLRPG